MWGWSKLVFRQDYQNFSDEIHWMHTFQCCSTFYSANAYLFFFLILFHCLIFLRELVNGFLLHRVSSLEIVGLQSFCIMNISLKNWASLDNWQVWISLSCSTWNFEQLVDSVTWKVTIITEPLCGIQWTMKKGKKQEYSGLIQLPSSL